MSNFWGAYQNTKASTTHIDLGDYRNGLNILSLYQLKI